MQKNILVLVLTLTLLLTPVFTKLQNNKFQNLNDMVNILANPSTIKAEDPNEDKEMFVDSVHTSDGPKGPFNRKATSPNISQSPPPPPQSQPQNDRAETRRTEDGTQYIPTRLSRFDSALDVYMTEVSDARNRKRANNDDTKRWPYRTPYVFDKFYSNSYYRTIVKSSMKFLNSRTCLNLVDETDNWDRSNPEWFVQHGYQINCFILIVNGSGCSTNGGSPPESGYGTLNASVCTGTNINLHETLHALGIAHTQQGSAANRHISVFMENVRSNLQYTYTRSSAYKDRWFNVLSTMHYENWVWSQNNDLTFDCLRYDRCHSDDSLSTEGAAMEEINRRYNCSAVYCGNSVDCSPGYLTTIDGVCKCVCPEGLDSASKCKDFINKANKDIQWPSLLTLIAGGEDYKCPTGFNPTGWLSFTGTYANVQSAAPVDMPQKGLNIYIPFCARTKPTSSVDWDSWPMGGEYCVIKPVGVNCGGVFNEYVIKWESRDTVTTNGSLGDITVKGNVTTLKTCCRNMDNPALPIDLPNETPMVLLSSGTCPIIRGMRSTKFSLTLWTPTSSGSGGPAKVEIYLYSYVAVMHLCYYQPAVYGCNKNVTLNSATRSVTITTPGYPQARPPNKRCIYSFNVPDGAQVRITFNDFNMSTDDKFLIRRFDMWQEASRVPNINTPYQIVSEGSFMWAEFWSSYQTLSNRGVKFTADVLLPEESCYDMKLNGMDYIGDTSVTETWETCLDWKDTRDCHDSPYNAWDALIEYFEDNKCRNAGGDLIQPWCYTHKNGSNCFKRYCDVCNTKEPIDSVGQDVCAEAIKADSSFCTLSVQRNTCFKSCNLARPSSVRTGSCGAPKLPSDGVLMSASKSTYNIGDRVYVGCKQSGTDVQAAMLCKKTGWTKLESACTECPNGWVIHGDRCFYFTAAKYTRPDAAAFCKSHGRNSTLFQLREEADSNLVKNTRMALDITTIHTWVGGELIDCPPKKWVFSDCDTEITYFNWTEGSATSNLKSNCIYLYRESSGSGKTGAISSTTCSSSTKNNVACQMDKLYFRSVVDKVPTCQDALTENPYFCSDFTVTGESFGVCSKSCGRSPDTGTCSTPSSSTYIRTSPDATIKAGEVMTFACKPDYFLMSGDTARACGIKGSLLGTAPVCSAKPLKIDVGLDLVRIRDDEFPDGKAFLLDYNGYRVPFDGKITIWYSYCQTAGTIYFLAYRKSGSKYVSLGYNQFNCIPATIWSYRVSVSDQIQVAAGDIVGAFSPDADALCVTDCKSADYKTMSVVMASAANITVLQSATFSESKCIIPSIAYRVKS